MYPYKTQRNSNNSMLDMNIYFCKKNLYDFYDIQTLFISAYKFQCKLPDDNKRPNGSSG